MTDAAKREPLTLKRWSQRKLAAARDAQATPAAVEPPNDATSPAAASAASGALAPQAAADAPPSELPPVESLTIDSDFSAFMRPDVDETLKRAALRKLLRDPSFNVMDGLDIYIDDYSKPDPIAPEIVRQLMQARYIFDPPTTRVNADGHVEDVPAADAAQTAPAPAPEGDALPPPASVGTPAANDIPAPAPEQAAVQSELPHARDVDSQAK